MKIVYITLVTLLFFLSLTQVKAQDAYQTQLNNAIEDVQDFGMRVNAFSQNPFQTGTALNNYYLGEKTLLLSRDTIFQLRANKLETTDDVADFHHRLKVLRSHGQNMLLQLLRALENRDEEGFLNIEAPKHETTMEELIKKCKEDAACVAAKLKNPETHMHNIFIDNLAFASQIFKQIPYMHEVELAGIYQLIQLTFLEALYGRTRVANVEFKLFIEKQKKLKKEIEDNRNLSATERNLHSTMIKNTVKRWKVRIAKRKFDHKEEFKEQALALREKNKDLWKQLVDVRRKNPEVDTDQKKSCGTFLSRRRADRKRCKLRKKLQEKMAHVGKGKNTFLGKEETKLPSSFWNEI